MRAVTSDDAFLLSRTGAAIQLLWQMARLVGDQATQRADITSCMEFCAPSWDCFKRAGEQAAITLAYPVRRLARKRGELLE